MSTPKPRRCSKRWLDGDCPDEILAIIDHGPNEPAERYDIIYTDVQTVKYDDSPRIESWLTYYCVNSSGGGSHGELQAHEVAAYRYRIKHKYTKWSTLPDAVKRAVRDDIAEAARYAAEYEAEQAIADAKKVTR